jgi:Protein of unknown function (DUF3667)
MSHGKERHEKNCLNCNAQLNGRFCHVCGQENLEPKENFATLANHFFEDVTHFDGKFFSTLKLLLLKPGFLSHEYLLGKRASYLNPIRMYVFTAFVFFLVLFSSNSIHTISVEKNKRSYAGKNDSLEERLDTTTNPAQIKLLEAQLQTAYKKRKIGFETMDSTHSLFKIDFSDLPNTVKAYDSSQLALPIEKRDGFFERSFNEKSIDVSEKYNTDKNAFVNEFAEHFSHDIPKMMFIFLPLVALVLQLLYFRERKEFYYVSHGIFVIHFYIVAYILMLISIFFNWLDHVSHWSVFNYLAIVPLLAIFFYLYKAMRNFYKQGRGKTIIKFLLFNIAILILFVALAVSLFFISFYQV